MKVLLVNQTYFPFKGGVENSLRHLYEVASHEGDTPSIFVSNVKIDRNRPERILTYRTLRKFRAPILTPLVDIISVFFYSIFRLRPKSFDLVLSRHYVVGYVLSWFVNVNKHVYVVPGTVKYQDSIEHKGGLLRNLHFGLLEWIQRRYIQRLKHVVVFSENMKSEVQSIAPSSNPLVLKPGVDSNRFSPSVDKVNIDADHNYKLLLMCRMVSAKGPNYALDIVKALPDYYSLTVVGNGVMLPSMKERVQNDPELKGKVTFTGNTDSPEDMYRGHHAFMMTSVYEPFGQTILEALASGIPVVHLNSESISIKTATREIIGTSDCGVSVDPSEISNRPEVLTNWINDFYQEREARVRACRALASSFNWGTLYKEVKKRVI